MTDDNNTAIDAIQIDEEILTPYTVSDEALEAAAGGRVLLPIPTQDNTDCLRSIICC